MRWACATLDGCPLEIPEPDASGLRDPPAPAAPPHSENAARAARRLSSARCDGPVLRSTVVRLKYLSRTHRAYETHRRALSRHIRKISVFYVNINGYAIQRNRVPAVPFYPQHRRRGPAEK